MAKQQVLTQKKLSNIKTLKFEICFSIFLNIFFNFNPITEFLCLLLCRILVSFKNKFHPDIKFSFLFLRHSYNNYSRTDLLELTYTAFSMILQK